MNAEHPPRSPLHQPALHDSGYKHTSGEALYVDDLPLPPGTLHALPVGSNVARGRITACDASAALAIPGVRAVLFARDIPGDNLIGPIVHDEPLLADGEVFYCGQAIAVVIADDIEACRDGVQAVRVDIEPLEPILDIETAIERESWLVDPHVIARGDVRHGMAHAATILRGETRNGAQDHFYLETHATLALPEEDGCVRLYSSTQHPTEVQKLVAHVLGLGSNQVVCEVPRMGGAFGGKESQASNYACMAALGAIHTGRPVKVWLDRDTDMAQTGKRHPFWTRYEAGFDNDGRLIALDVHIYADGGWSIDLTGPILDRALFHLDNAYFIEALRFEGRACRTNLPSNTAFRGFGGPQGMLVVEEALNRYAEQMELDPADVRRLNYYGAAPRDLTPYGQQVTENRLERIHTELLTSADYLARRDAIERFNAGSRFVKRGIGFQPVKFGISFTKSILNQAGALMLVYADGTVQLNHGGTEMGQGLHTKMMAVAAHELGVPLASVRAMPTSTEKVPNTSATAASSGADLNGQAVKAACEEIRERMRPVAARLLEVSAADAATLHFEGGYVSAPAGGRVTFAEVATACWAERVSLSATGFYRTPGVHYDAQAGRGRPFYYYAYGGAVTEVEVSGLTGEHRLLRADILHDVGASLVPGIDLGQVEGGFVQGLGWLTMEEVLFDANGRGLTTGPSTYKVPAVGDVPSDFRVSLLERAPQPGVIHGSKAVGEPPLMLAISVVTALRHAIAAFGRPGYEVQLAPPCTPEAILRAIVSQRDRALTHAVGLARKVAASPEL
ncbi:MAG: xanthine dehydrogenase molybdopterin binding subunit [Deltaproteobacteria bacterium]|nr:xanthine dehydrogenase molybdopterin binding subunit [Deltaproteobacteria bacterium]